MSEVFQDEGGFKEFDGGINQIAAALAKAQGVMPKVIKNKNNPHFKSDYADYAAIVEVIKGPLSANGICWTHCKRRDEHGWIEKTLLIHSSGQYLSTDHPVSVTGRPQEVGSAVTYAKRYGLSELTGVAIADDDDDGNAAQDASKGNGHASDEPISEEQYNTLNSLMAELDVIPIKFTKHLKIAMLRNLPASRFDEAVAKLESKRSQA